MAPNKSAQKQSSMRPRKLTTPLRGGPSSTALRRRLGSAPPEVDDLLSALARAGSFMDRPAIEAEFAQAPPPAGLTRRPITEGPGARIGAYKLLEPIGEGGMGVVYMAEQDQPVRRKVALKIIKPGMDTRPGHRPLRGRATGPGHDGPPQHRPRPRRRHHRLRPPLLRHGAGQGRPDHRVLRRRISSPCASGWSCSCRSARPSSMRTRRGSSTATSSRPTCW